MRARHKSWQSDRPLKRDSRKVVWFEGDGSIRLMFEDQFRKVNFITRDHQEATDLYEGFIAGEIQTHDICDLLAAKNRE